ncbi:MAG: hypothetical protein KIS73_03010 [Enhydrobacter sp.]|nr:hypothetical protein [Enhydrobacter sp.]
MGRKLLLLIALLATLVVLGCWDNRQSIQHVLDKGYATTAQVIGAQYQRNMPIAADGWRPRFVEQELSVDLRWQGKDGKPREFRKVPISEALARSIVNGDQVRLVTLPVKVIDDESAVPVITADASARLESLQSWLTAAGYVALASWAGFAALTLLQGRGHPVTAMAGSAPRVVPPVRTLIGLAALVVGGFLTFSAWTGGRSVDAISLGGSEVTAEIVDATVVPAKDGNKASYAVRLAWKDGQGSVHHFGPIPVTEAFWTRITRDGQLVVRQTPIRYRQDDPQPRPLIVDDAPERQWWTQAAMVAGLGLLVLGSALLVSGMRALRNEPLKR